MRRLIIFCPSSNLKVREYGGICNSSHVLILDWIVSTLHTALGMPRAPCGHHKGPFSLSSWPSGDFCQQLSLCPPHLCVHLPASPPIPGGFWGQVHCTVREQTLVYVLAGLLSGLFWSVRYFIIGAHTGQSGRASLETPAPSTEGLASGRLSSPMNTHSGGSSSNPYGYATHLGGPRVSSQLQL